MQALPEQADKLDLSQIAIAVNELIRNVSAIDPSINTNCGKVSPGSQLLRAGKLAYANDTDWDPGEGEGYYFYNGTSWKNLSNLNFANEYSAKTSGVATLTAAGADLLTLNIGTVTAGQKYWISGQIKDGTKGGTAGTTKMSILLSSGTATIKFLSDATQLATSNVVTAGITLSCLRISDILHITGSGTCVMKIVGLSAGSDTTVAAGDVQIYAARIK